MRLTPARLALRAFVAVAALLLLDASVVRWTQTDYSDAYRLPQAHPLTALPDLIAHLDEHETSTAPVAVFLGASPTYGYRVRDPRHTFPAAFVSASRDAGTPLRAYNVAWDGQFVSDQCLLADRLSRDADVFYIQLTYHTFNPAARDKMSTHFPELPSLLGVAPGDAEASAPVTAQSAASRLNAAFYGFLGGHWSLFRDRALVRDKLLALPASGMLCRLLQEDTTSGDAGPPEAYGPFEDLEPEAQSVVVERYSETGVYRISPQDAEVNALRRLVALLRQRHKRAVFYMAPLNWDAIRSYDVVDPRQYRKNVALLRRIVESGRFTFLDPTTDLKPMGGRLFSDISHTTDDGGTLFGRLLYSRTCTRLAHQEVER